MRLGFADPDAAAALLCDPAVASLDAFGLLTDLSKVADPDLALRELCRFASNAGAATLAAVHADPVAWRRLLPVLGASAALGDHLVRHPEHWRALAEPSLDRPPPDRELLTAVGADPTCATPIAEPAEPALDRLRVAYRERLLAIAARDLSGELDIELAAAELSDLAAAALEAALAIARAQLPADAVPCRLAVIGMGKVGGRELNYVSDVDVVFVAEPADPTTAVEPALRAAHQLAAGLMRACSAATSQGALWPVDAGLRPEGNAGALVRTLPSHRTYYERWAKTWEFQALLKARVVAGHAQLGGRYVESITPLVWSAADRPAFVEDVQSMRRRVEESLSPAQADRELKLGPGGLRDVEFAVQLLQLVHGRSDETLRSGSTLTALRALAKGGYVGRADAAALEETYRFLRTVEHRLQLRRLRRTHVLPDAPAELRRLGRSLGYRFDPEGELTKAWRDHQRTARRLHEKLFYRPLLLAVSRLPADEARLSMDAARLRLEALGFADPEGALRHLSALTQGVSRRAAIQRTLLPVMLGWFADAADPDAGLLAFRQVSDGLGTTPWYLRLLRDAGVTAQRLARVLASSRYVSDLLLRAPDAVAILAEEAPAPIVVPVVVRTQMRAAGSRAAEPEDAIAAVRAIRRRELLRVAVADVLTDLPVEHVGSALSEVTGAAIDGALDVAIRVTGGPLPTRLAVIAMGRLGGHEQGYGSDADVLFVHDPLPGADERAASDAAHAVANEVRRLLALPTPDPPLDVDAGLRPEGKQGPLVRSLASYAAYYERWAQAWERQALLRAEPIAGDTGVGARFMDLIESVRWPDSGIDDKALREIRRIKARVEAERLPRGADATLHTKLGRGGLADVEWTVQALQMAHAGTVADLRTTNTLDAIQAAAAAGLLSDEDARALDDAWRLATRVRNAIVLVRGRAADAMPKDVRERAGVARLLGYAPSDVGAFIEHYRRTTRRARSTVERVFYA